MASRNRDNEPRPDPIKGRGAAVNPANRFEATHSEPDWEHLEGADDGQPHERAVPTVFLPDQSQSIIARNDSPDIPFTYSINPYRGCEHGCAYCLSGDTPVLMADGTTKALAEVRAGDAIYGTIRKGWYRRYVRTLVLAHWRVEKPAYRVTLEDGTTLIAGEDHRFLTERGWKFVTGTEQGVNQRPHLTPNNKLMGVGAFAYPPCHDDEYKRGYLTGLIRGDGHLGSYRYARAGRTQSDQYRFRLALTDAEALLRAKQYLADFGVATHDFTFQEATPTRKCMRGIRASARTKVELVRGVVSWPTAPSQAWRHGFLAGIFDAEGCYSAGVLRICNTDEIIIEHITSSLELLGFKFVIEGPLSTGRAKPIKVVRLCGGLREHLRFFRTTDPAILRKRNIEGQAVKNTANLRVVSIEPLGVTLPLFDITTGTGDFIANGVISHNCYARPTHETLGMNAGLDFESKILVKFDAPALLRKELADPKWNGETISVSGVTDCYQPAERKFRITRGLLEVMNEANQPVGIVTKNALVARDLDLLAPMASRRLVHVWLSVTTLDAELARRLEPRTASPAARLRTIRELTDAGVPVGVMVAPVIPGLNDHQVPQILEAAAEAGARSAGHVLLRLPWSVEPIFLAWLESHYPLARPKVESLLRSARSGKLYRAGFGHRMRGEGPYAEGLKATFRVFARKFGLDGSLPPLDHSQFIPPRLPGGQMRLF